MAEVISATSLREGVIIELPKNKLYEVVDYAHIKIARSGAFVKCKLKDFYKGGVIECTFKPDEKINLIKIFEKKGQFLYNDKDIYYFMEEETYEQIAISKEQIEDKLPYLKENLEVLLLYDEDRFLTIKLPETVELQVIDTEPGFKGDTVSASLKPAVVETNLTVQVPLFIEKGDTIKIDTRTGKYISRC
jgi:elongation factor P